MCFWELWLESCRSQAAQRRSKTVQVILLDSKTRHQVFCVGKSHGKRGEVWESIVPRLMVFRPRLPALSAPFLLDQQVSVLIFSSKGKFLLHRSAGAAGTGGSTKTPRLCICKHKPVPGRGSLGQPREGHVCALCLQPSSFGQAISQRC